MRRTLGRAAVAAAALVGAACGSAPEGATPTSTVAGAAAPTTTRAAPAAGATAASTVTTARRRVATSTSAPRPRVAGAPGDAAVSPSPEPGVLTEVGSFGTNPGRLKMFEYAPKGLAAGRAVVVVLHGCTQSAAGFDDESGWTSVADRLRFAVVLPEQQQSNNPSACWSFFTPNGSTRDVGEVRSIREMVEWELAHRGGDRRRVFVTGLSAGAAMTNVLLATHPDLFTAGAPIAGVAYRCASNAAETVACNNGSADKTPQQWGDLVRAASPWRGPWPRVSVWHGTADTTVSVKAMPEIVEQWTNVHGTDQTADREDRVSGYPHATFEDASGAPVVETFAISGMGHGQPIDPGTGADQCGRPAPYFVDVDLCAAARIAAWFGITA